MVSVVKVKTETENEGTKMTEHEIRMACLELLRASKLLLYWGDVECEGQQLRDVNEAKAVIDAYSQQLRSELPGWIVRCLDVQKKERP